MTEQQIKDFLSKKIEEQVGYIMNHSIELQCEVAGSMPFHFFEALSEEERANHVNDGLVQMPEDILEGILLESTQWIDKDEVGTSTVGESNSIVEKYGEYHEVLEKMQRYERALKDIAECNGVLDIYDAVRRAKREL